MNSIIKLINGETIIAEIVHQDENTTSVLEPLLLEIGEGPSGRPMMIAMTWVPLTKSINLVNLNTSHVVAIAAVDEDIDAYYIKSLSTLKGNDKETEEDEETEEEVNDPWMEKFGQPIELSANTVH